MRCAVLLLPDETETPKSTSARCSRGFSVPGHSGPQTNDFSRAFVTTPATHKNPRSCRVVTHEAHIYVTCARDRWSSQQPVVHWRSRGARARGAAPLLPAACCPLLAAVGAVAGDPPPTDSVHRNKRPGLSGRPYCKGVAMGVATACGCCCCASW